jgi:hypothetical protein
MQHVFAYPLAKSCKEISKMGKIAGHLWLTPIILASQELELKKIVVQSQPWLIKTPFHKIHRAGRVSQGEGPSSSPSTIKKKKAYFV